MKNAIIISNKEVKNKVMAKETKAKGHIIVPFAIVKEHLNKKLTDK